MQLKRTSIEWAFKHIHNEGDTDLFPIPFEFAIIRKNWTAVCTDLSRIDINRHSWEGPRRLMVPKSEFGFRPVCQLDPLDAILFAAIVKEIGTKIERRRIPPASRSVFSYRFAPSTSGRLYSADTGWEGFWSKSQEYCSQYPYVLITDISDFYNQIYHHTIENQLIECGIHQNYWKAIKNLLSNVSEGVSRGVPIGPHPSHLLAELALIPIDNYVQSLNVPFTRYVDDFHIFCRDEKQAHSILFKLVDHLDKTQKVQLNRQKTVIKESGEFEDICEENSVDSPANDIERDVLSVVRGRTTGPYRRVLNVKLSDDELEKLSQQKIETMFEEYLDNPEIDYVRIRWLIRRLTQIGAPGAVEYIVRRFDDLLPAVSEIGRYFEAATPNYKGNWAGIGDKLIEILNNDLVQASEYLQVIILSMFSRIRSLNQINKLTGIYDISSPMCQRKIMLAASQAKASAWLSKLKGDYKNAGPWNRRSIIYSLRALPDDEKNFWLRSVKTRVDGLELLIANSI